MHVLGTPPAFILSQDQTLMFKFNSVPVSASCLFRLSALCWLSRFRRLRCANPPIPGFHCVRFVCSRSNLFDLQIEIFKIISRFIHCSVIKVRPLLSDLLFKRQLIYYITFVTSCQQLFYFSIASRKILPAPCELVQHIRTRLSFPAIVLFPCRSRVSLYILASLFRNVNTYFSTFFSFFFCNYSK